MTLLTDYPRAVSASHPQDKPKSKCTEFPIHWKREEFDVASGNGKAFGEGLAAQMLTKELALVVNVWLSNQIGSNGVGRVPNIVGYLQVPANHPMFAQFLGNLSKSFFDQYGVIFNIRDLSQGYTVRLLVEGSSR
ncbi:unnamed protein product [Aureobasidium pullulans]|nr:unnamed protein product [Aureobasidium pullulans]